MKMVFLTYKCSYAAALLRQMKDKNILVEAIFVENPTPYQKARIFLKLLGLVETAKTIFRRVLEILVPSTADDWRRNDFYYSYSNKVYTVDNFNGKQCEQLLMEIEPDVIVLGCSRIIRQSIINIPKIRINKNILDFI